MSGPAILMYSTPYCPYCVAARQLLKSKNVTWTEVSLETDPDRRAEMMARSGRRTVPQIFIDDTHVGGFDDLDALNRSGRLDDLLSG